MHKFQVCDKVAEVFKPRDRQIFSVDSLGAGKDARFIQGSPNLTDNKESIYLGNHSFVHACSLAYSQHHNLIIRPEDVWIAIITQFGTYVDNNAEKLRDRFVDFQGKKELEVRSAGTLFTAQFGPLSRLMEEQIAKNIKDPSVREWVVPNFSTTTPVDRVVGSVLLMATMQKYFGYKFSFCCGLPSVTLLGTVDDWKEIRHRADRLVEFDAGDNQMKKWSNMLLPVLDEFVSTASGNVNKDWWNRIAFHVGGGSGPTWLSGWITVFCVFNDSKNWIGDSHDYRSYMGDSARSEWIYIDTKDIPKGYLSVPVTVDDNGTVYKTEMYAGHVVTRIVDDGTTLVPQLDWCMIIPPVSPEKKLGEK